MHRQLALATSLFMIIGAGSALAVDLGQLKPILLDPQSPETSLFRIEIWPSFLFQAGAPVLINYRRSSAALTPGVATAGDLNCDDLSGSMVIEGADPNRLDADHDGIGCE